MYGLWDIGTPNVYLDCLKTVKSSAFHSSAKEDRAAIVSMNINFDNWETNGGPCQGTRAIIYSLSYKRGQVTFFCALQMNRSLLWLLGNSFLHSQKEPNVKLVFKNYVIHGSREKWKFLTQARGTFLQFFEGYSRYFSGEKFNCHFRVRDQ